MYGIYVSKMHVYDIYAILCVCIYIYLIKMLQSDLISMLETETGFTPN